MTTAIQQRKIMQLSATLLKPFTKPTAAQQFEAMAEAKMLLSRKAKLLLLIAD